MQLKPITIIGLGALWIATIAGAFYLGKDQPKSEGKLSSQPGSSNSEALTPGGASKGSKNANAGTKTAQGGGGESSEGIPLKQLLAQLKGTMRLGGMQNPNAMMKAMALLDKIRPEDFQEALSEAEAMTDQQMKMLVHMTVLGKWAEQDGPAAMKYAEEHSQEKGMMAQMAKMSVAAAWAEKDPEAVWKWYNDQKGEDTGPMGGQMVLMSLFSSMAAKDPEMAFKRLAEIEGPGKQMAIAGMFQSSMFDESKRAEILKLVDAMPDKSERDQAKMSMISQWVMLAPDEAIAYVKSQPAEEGNMLRTQVGTMYMMSNPKKGADFILEGATDENKAQKYSTIIGSWAHQDPNAAGAWLNEQPQGPHLDDARNSFVYATAQTDPGSAMVWATTITEPSKREASTSFAYQAWKKKDQASADEALGKSGLSAEQVQRIQSQAGDPSGRPAEVVPAATVEVQGN